MTMDLVDLIKKYFEERVSFDKDAFLKRLPALQGSKELGRGLANDNFLLDFGKDLKYVMRFNIWPDRVWYNGNPISVENEFLILKFLEPHGVAPKAYFLDASKYLFPFEFLIEEFVEQDTMHVSDDFSGVVKTVKRLHEVDVRHGVKFFRRDATVNEKMSLYETWLKEVSINNKTEIVDLFSRYAGVYKAYLQRNSDLLIGDSIIHRDLFPENFLHERRDGWRIVDWQTAVIGNPIQDIAYLLWDFIYLYTLKRPLNKEEQHTILKSYYGKQVDVDAILSKVQRLLPIFYIDLFLWLLYKVESFKKQDFNPELKEFLWKRIAAANDLILKGDQIEHWFSKMK
jgi:thiamine kinase-like enzyme